MKNNQKRSILITGGTGFIGSNLVRHFSKIGYPINLLVRKSSNLSRLDEIRQHVGFYEIDLTDTKKLEKLIKFLDPSYIFHLASFGNYYDQLDRKKMLSTNIVSLHSLLEATKNISYLRFVNAGSSSEYGRKTQPMKEKDNPEPETFYAATKLASTMYCRVFAKTFQKPITTLRFFSVYGPFEKSSRFIPIAIQSALSKKPIPVTLGNVRRDFIYVGDIVSAYEKLMICKPSFGEIYNIGVGKQYTNKEVVDTIAEILQIEVNIKIGGYQRRTFDNDFWVADITKAKKDLKWNPKFSLVEGIRKTIEWHIHTHEKKR